jgi:hypothetical protein
VEAEEEEEVEVKDLRLARVCSAGDEDVEEGRCVWDWDGRWKSVC